MNGLPEHLPPKWLESMHQRRACLLHFESEKPLSPGRARFIALDLLASNGEGEWDCGVVQLDSGGCDWEFRFKPRVPPVDRPHRSSAG